MKIEHKRTKRRIASARMMGILLGLMALGTLDGGSLWAAGGMGLLCVCILNGCAEEEKRMDLQLTARKQRRAGVADGEQQRGIAV